MASGVKTYFLTSLTDVKTTDVEGVGTLRFEGDKVYKWVKFTYENSVAAAAGNLAYYDDTDCTTVTADKSASVGVVAGVFMADSSTNNTYMWIQVAGVAEGVNCDDSTVNAAGIVLTASSTDGRAEAKDAATDQVIGVSLEASSSYTSAACCEVR